MTLIALLLVAVGCADLSRARRQTPRLLPLGVGLGALLAGAVLAGATVPADLALLAWCGVIVIGWLVLSDRAERRHTGELWPLLALGAGLLVLLTLAGAGSTAAGPLAEWLSWTNLPALQTVSAERFVLVLGVLLIQLSTANEVVRLVLATVGAIKPHGQPQPSDRLKGGRLLGPMERIFILGLGLAGQVGAAGLVIAAKGLIRFPELSAGRQRHRSDPEVGIDEVTEYFLLGSFLSWLIAVAAIGLVALT